MERRQPATRHEPVTRHQPVTRRRTRSVTSQSTIPDPELNNRPRLSPVLRGRLGHLIPGSRRNIAGELLPEYANEPGPSGNSVQPDWRVNVHQPRRLLETAEAERKRKAREINALYQAEGDPTEYIEYINSKSPPPAPPPEGTPRRHSPTPRLDQLTRLRILGIEGEEALPTVEEEQPQGDLVNSTPVEGQAFATLEEAAIGDIIPDPITDDEALIIAEPMELGIADVTESVETELLRQV